MTEQHKTRISKLLSLILRHKPETVGLKLNEEGWVDTNSLLQQLALHNQYISLQELEEIVATNNKQRFAFSEDHSRIRASQGHSVEVNLNLEPRQPPEYLYHGTVSKFLDAIHIKGLKKMQRQHVHLSANIETAIKVGSRRGRPLVLRIRSLEMFAAGYSFYLSDNGVWLAEEVPVQYIDFNFNPGQDKGGYKI